MLWGVGPGMKWNDFLPKIWILTMKPLITYSLSLFTLIPGKSSKAYWNIDGNFQFHDLWFTSTNVVILKKHSKSPMERIGNLLLPSRKYQVCNSRKLPADIFCLFSEFSDFQFCNLGCCLNFGPQTFSFQCRFVKYCYFACLNIIGTIMENGKYLQTKFQVLEAYSVIIARLSLQLPLAE